jgi:hypothetical protein
MNTVRIDWSKIDTVLLDMDGTLLDLRFDNWFYSYRCAMRRRRVSARRMRWNS